MSADLGPSPEAAGRRAYDQEGALVVPLREHLEQRIDGVSRELGQRITSGHTELTMAIHQLQKTQEAIEDRQSAEHQVVAAKLDTLTAKIELLERADERQAVSRKTIATMVAGAVTVITLVQGALAIVITSFT